MLLQMGRHARDTRLDLESNSRLTSNARIPATRRTATEKSAAKTETVPDVGHYRRLFWIPRQRLLCFAFGTLILHEAHPRLHDRFG